MKKLFALLVVLGVAAVFAAGPVAEAVIKRPLPAIWDKVRERWAHLYPSVFEPLGPVVDVYVGFYDDSVPGIEKPPALSTWTGRGADPDAKFSMPSYTAEGLPLTREREGNGVRALEPLRRVKVANAAQLVEAIHKADPGDEILLAPGSYEIREHGITVHRSGHRSHPIVVRAERLGDARVRFDSVDGFHVDAPYWVFENLEVVGIRENHSRCEHAFHVVSSGHSIIIRNNRIHDFNAHIKANGAPREGSIRYPDGGLVEGNSLYNEKPRRTGNPVTLVNVVAADDWRIHGNLLADFAKHGGDRVSYGALIKGNARGGVIERNLVVCALAIPPRNTSQVGLSLGGGGTGRTHCRDQDCAQESREGIVRNNIVMHCPDVGIYLNRVRDATVVHNTLFATWGIDARGARTHATIAANAYSGFIAARAGARIVESGNVVIDGSGPFRDPRHGDFALSGSASELMVTGESTDTAEDFCGTPRTSSPGFAGALSYSRDTVPCAVFPTTDW